MRRWAFLGSVAVVVWATISVPMPFFETRPGSYRPVEDLVTIGVDGEPVNGDLALLTIRQVTPNILELLWIWSDPGREVEPVDQRVPDGLDLEVYRDIQRAQFSSSFTTAVAVAAEYAGYEVSVRTAAVVAQVLPGGPSSGALEPGDEITAVDGVPTSSGADVVDELGRDEPELVELTVTRDEESVVVPVQMEVLEELGRPGLGIVIETVTRTVELPFDASVDRRNVVGPSAGLMIALTTVDLLLEEDLARGRSIAGTGTINGDGSVGRVGSIEQKVETAIRSGAELVLVPLEQADEAAAAAGGRIEVAGVADFADAVEVLRGSSVGVAAPQAG